MCGCVACHDKPCVTPVGVIPEFLVQSRRVGSEIDIVDECFHGAGVSRIWPSDGGIAKIEKLIETAFATTGARDAHTLKPLRSLLLMKIGIGSHALLIDHPTCGEAIEPVVLGSGMWRLVR